MPHASPQRLKVQQSSFAKNIAINADCDNIFNILTSPDLIDQIEELLPEHRARLFPLLTPIETLSMFNAQVLSQDRSCQNIVNQAAMKALVAGLTPCSTHTGAYCKARQRLPLEVPLSLARFLGRSIEESIPTAWRWHDRRLRVVDGTSVSMPDTPENQSIYRQQGGQKPGLGFPVARLIAVTDLCSGAILDAAFGRFQGKGSDVLTPPQNRGYLPLSLMRAVGD